MTLDELFADENAEEKLARALCKIGNIDPDAYCGTIGNDRFVQWQMQINQTRAFIAALKEVTK